MKLSQRLSVELSQSRTKIQHLAGLDAPTEDQAQELEKRMADHTALEKRYQAAVTADGGDDPDPEPTDEGDAAARELRSLEQRFSVSRIMDSALNDRPIRDGVEAELHQHLTMDGNMIPLAMLAGQEAVPSGELETRAVTPAPSDVGATQSEILSWVFPMGCAAYLGVRQPTVGVGERVFPVLATAATVETPAKSAPVSETTGSFTSTVLSPRRLQASYIVGLEDLRTFAGMEQSLRMNLSAALSDKLDERVIAQFFAASGGLPVPTAPSAEANYDKYRTEAFSSLDGRFASKADQLKWLTNAATYKHAATVYRVPDNDVSALDSLMRTIGDIRLNANMPAEDSSTKISSVIAVKGGGHGGAVSPIWDGIAITRDPYGAHLNEGQVQLTATMLFNCAIIRPAGYDRIDIKTAD